MNTQISSVDAKDDMQEAMGVIEAQEFKKKSVSGAVSYTVRSLFLYGIGVFTSLVLGAYLSADEFGIYGIVTQIVGLLQFFSDVGLGPALIQMKSEPSTHEYRVVFTVQQILSWLIFAVIVIIAFSGWVTPKIGHSGLLVLLALGISFPLSSLKIIPAIKLERKLDFSKLVIPNIFEQVIYNAILIFLVVMMRWGVEAYAIAVFVRAVVGVVAMYVVQSWDIGLAWKKSTFRQIIGTGVKFQLSDFLARIKDQLFYLGLGWFLPLREFGYITWAKNWSQFPYSLTVQNVIAITFPAYSRLQNDKRRLQLAIEKTMYFISLSIFPMLVGMSVFIIPFTHLVLRYEKWQPALLTFGLFTLSIGWAAISTPLTNTLNAIGKINTTLKLMLMWTGLTWALTPILVWKFGFNGVGIAAFIISFTSVIPVYLVKKIVPIRIREHVGTPFLSASMMAIVGFAGLPYWSRSFAWMLTGIVSTSLIYLVCIILFGRKKLITEFRGLRSK